MKNPTDVSAVKNALFQPMEITLTTKSTVRRVSIV